MSHNYDDPSSSDVYPSITSYYHRLSSMDETQRSLHLMEQDRHADHAWPDYLDYIEEWTDLFEHKLSLTRKDFIYTVLARRNTRISCGNHFHTFTTSPPPLTPDMATCSSEFVVISRPDDYLDVSSCWYKTILSMDKVTAFSQSSLSSITLSTIEHESLKRLAALRLTTEEDMTHLQLSFDDFKRLWWSRESRETAHKILRESTPLLNRQSQSSSSTKTIIDDAIQALVIDPISLIHPPPKAHIIPSTKSEVIQSAADCIADHGLHMAILASEVPKNTFNAINEIRQSVKGSLISPVQLANAMDKCTQCRALSLKPTFTSPGLYYAPPGTGKSTVATNHLFVGIDTDWLINGSSFDHIVAPFLRNNIPVLTNMHNLCSCSGEKMFGFYNLSSLRKDPSGKYYTTPTELSRFPVIYQDDICLSTSSRGFLSNHILRLYRENYLYNLTRRTFYDRPHKLSFRAVGHTLLNLSEQTTVMRSWRSRRSRGRHFGLRPTEFDPG